jgi:hypothetical protein
VTRHGDRSLRGGGCSATVLLPAPGVSIRATVGVPTMLLSIAALVAALAPCPQAAPRTFVELDPATVVASVHGVDAVLDGEPGCLVEVEVERPRGFDGYVEALRFRITPRARGAEPVEVRRFDAPYYGRAGRAAGPKAVVYPLLVPFEAKAAKGAKVEVLEVSAWTGAPPDEEAPVEVGRPTSSTNFDADFQQSLVRSTLPLRNLRDREVDVVLLATYSGPKRATTLVGGRAPANGTLDLVVRFLPTGLGERLGADITRAKVVDWSVIDDDGATAARRSLAAAWDDSFRLPDELFPLAAKFTFVYEGEGKRHTRAGALQLDRTGKVTVVLDGAHDANAARSTTADLEALLWCLTRPAFDTLQLGPVTLQRGGRRQVVRVGENPLRGSHSGSVSFVIEDGLIVQVSPDPLGAELGDGNPTAWTWSKTSTPRLECRRLQRFAGNPDAYQEEQFNWSQASGTWLPSRITVREGEFVPGAGSLETFTFAEWSPAASTLASPTVPTGPLADELRAAWDTFYRYPTPHARFAGEFRAVTPGTDGVWRGRKDVRGSFALEEAEGGFWRRSEATISGKKLTPDEHASLQGAVLDRVLMWSGRDVCRMPCFDEMFRGAELARDGEWILAPGASVKAVQLANGRVKSIRTAFGGEATLRWDTIDGVLLPVERRAGDEAVRVKWKELEAGWWFPVRVDFEAVFGRDWGPESLELTGVSVSTLD